jgi:carbon starvation protein
VLAAQFGFYPGFTWIVLGVVLGGAVHDFVILVSSTRRNGRSLAEIARDELGPVLGGVTAVAILCIIVVALAGLGNVVVGALAESAWGVFTVSLSIPIALLIGGKWIADSAYADLFRHSKPAITLAIAGYGFVASVLPVWLLLCPRDYLSSYLKLGTIFLLVVGIVIVNPPIQMPGFTEFVHGGGPIIKGPLFPFVFITIACGAISGFHALVSSGTTPKMVDKESDCRPIAYGAMLMEGLVGVTALIAACVMPPEDYVAINTDPKIALLAPAAEAPGLARSMEELRGADAVLNDHDRQLLGLRVGQSIVTLADQKLPASKLLALSNGTLAALDYEVDPQGKHATSLTDRDFARLGIHVKELPALSKGSGEVVAARTGGGVSLAVGMARVFSGLPGMSTLLAYWYHFAIMFEALFILTTIDTGTRIGRFLMQEFLGRFKPSLGESTSMPGALLATTLIVTGWTYFILTGNISTIWPMFGIANQLLACAALCVGTTIILREAKRKHYAWVTLAPLCFVGITTISAGIQSVRLIYYPMTQVPATRVTGLVNSVVTSVLLVGVAFVIGGSVLRWIALWKLPRPAAT